MGCANDTKKSDPNTGSVRKIYMAIPPYTQYPHFWGVGPLLTKEVFTLKNRNRFSKKYQLEKVGTWRGWTFARNHLGTRLFLKAPLVLFSVRTPVTSERDRPPTHLQRQRPFFGVGNLLDHQSLRVSMGKYRSLCSQRVHKSYKHEVVFGLGFFLLVVSTCS